MFRLKTKLLLPTFMPVINGAPDSPKSNKSDTGRKRKSRYPVRGAMYVPLDFSTKIAANRFEGKKDPCVI